MLRARLFLNWIPFVVILVAVGVYAIVLFSRLAKDVDVTVMENYRSATAALNMGLALSHIDKALQMAMTGEKISGTSTFDEHSNAFKAELDVLSRNALSFGKTNLIELQMNYQNFHDSGLAILRLNQARDQARIYAGDIGPRLLRMTLLLEQIRKINHKNILDTTEHIQQITRHITRLMLIAMAVAVLISVWASVQFGKAVMRPIQFLTKATREVGQGNLDQTVPVLSQDELGQLANSFNKMAGLLKAYRQSTNEQIVRLHHTMEAALASFPDPIFVLDRQGHIELKNLAAENLGQRLKLDGGLPGDLPETADKVLRTGIDFLPHSFEEVLSFRVNGEERAFLPRILTMRGEKNEPVGVAVVLHDVTRFRLLDDAKTNLVATVSHELKTPLTSVRMALYLLLEKSMGPLTAKQEELLQTARKDAERLLRILNDLLDLTRLEAGKSGLNRELITPSELVRSISDEMRQNVVNHGLTLSTSVELHLPSVSVDRQRISHVFQNFLTNAIRHSPPHGEIQLRASRTNEGVQFSVRDHGPGVPERYVGSIFDRFFRIPGQTKAGAGLGLSIAREIVVAHGGRIGVHSKPGDGSEFYFVLANVEEEKGTATKSQNKGLLSQSS